MLDHKFVVHQSSSVPQTLPSNLGPAMDATVNDNHDSNRPYAASTGNIGTSNGVNYKVSFAVVRHAKHSDDDDDDRATPGPRGSFRSLARAISTIFD